MLRQSLPMWERGLKHRNRMLDISAATVAPHVGAWIETPKMLPGVSGQYVAPHVGAWIETYL